MDNLTKMIEAYDKLQLEDNNIDDIILEEIINKYSKNDIRT